MDQIALKGGQNGADTMNSLVVTKKNFCYAMMNRLRIDLDKPVVTYTRLSTMQRLRRLWRENPALQFVATYRDRDGYRDHYRSICQGNPFIITNFVNN